MIPQCPNCHKTFSKNNIQLHVKSCLPLKAQQHKPETGKSTQNIFSKSSKSPAPIKSSSPGPSPIQKEKVFTRPKAVMCHICGREFGTASIEIHTNSCAKLWEEREKQKPPNQRRPVPSAPVDIPISKTMKNLNAHNERVYESFNQNVMVRCPNCFRTFLEDRIEIHLKSCTSDNPHKLAPSVSKSSEGQDIKTYVQNSNLKVYKAEEEKAEKNIVRPKAVMCHICGKEYGTASIEIHAKACAKIWEERESKKPANQRKPVPTAPQDLPIGTSQKALEKRNIIVSEAFTNNVMVECPNCSRTFLEDRIEVHLRSCTSENPHKPPPINPSKSPDAKKFRSTEKPANPLTKSENIYDNFQKTLIKPKSVMCHICGREFGTASIEIHTKNCAKLWEEREKQKPPNQRRPVPSAPVDIPISKTMKNLNAHNERVYESFNQNVMVRCPNCFRTFLEDRIEIHLKSCTSDNPHKLAPSVSKSSEGQDIKTYVQNSNLKVYKAEEEKAEKNIVRPKAVMCHIWYYIFSGKEYGTASIEIHAKACAKIWEERESKKPANQRKPVPAAPQDLPLGTSQNALDKRNNIVSEAFNTNVMQQCPNCFRTFLEDRLQIHLKSCTPEKPHKPPSSIQTPIVKQSDQPALSSPIKHSEPSIVQSARTPILEKTFLRPKTLMCHICGREFGTASLEIHLKTCEKLWEEREMQKSPEKRRPIPTAPTSIPTNKTLKNLIAHNELVSEHFNTNTLTPCPNCFRTFLEDRLQIHLRSCTSENPHKPPPSKTKP